MEENPSNNVTAGEGMKRSFDSCPVCRNKNLLHVDDVTLCAECSWDSIALSVWAGDYDHVFSQDFTEKGNPIPKRPSRNIQKSLDPKTKVAS